MYNSLEAWLEDKLEEATSTYENNKVVVSYLQPELNKFRDKTNNTYNTYAVRLAANHRNSMARDLEEIQRFAELLEIIKKVR